MALTQHAGVLAASYWTYITLGYVHLRLGELAEARQIFTKSVRQFYDVQEHIGVVYTLEGFASLAVRQEQPERAVCLLAFADRRRVELHDPRPFSEQEDVDRDLAIIRQMVDKAAFDTAYTAGTAMTTEEVMAYASKGKG